MEVGGWDLRVVEMDKRRVAQVVATVVAQSKPDTSVLFEIDNQPISVPISSGAQVSGPVLLWQVIPNATPS